MIATPVATAAVEPALKWWGARRLRYNVALIVAGALAFVAYNIVCAVLLPPEADAEVTLSATIVQGEAYLIMIGLANLCFFLGPLSERVHRPVDTMRFRQVFFRLGYWFSVLLPFSIPLLLAYLALFHPDHWRHAPSTR